MPFEFRGLAAEDAEAVSRLAHHSFNTFVAPDWGTKACEAFLGESSPASIRDKLAGAAFAQGAFANGDIVAFILLTKPALLAMLFVHPQFLRRGLGRQLWEQARAHVEEHFPDTKTVEVNASRYGVAFYRMLGFVPLSTEFDRNGARATRMACWLPARGLGASL